MKKLFLIFPLLFVVQTIRAQADSANERKQLIRTAADLKSGNSRDIMPDFFQLAFKDLTGSSRAFAFQSSLFAIEAKTDSNVWVDTAYLRRSFARNFAFGFQTSLDSNFHFNGR